MRLSIHLNRKSFADFVVSQQILDLFPIEDSPSLQETNHEIAAPMSELLGRVQSRLEVQKPVSANDEQYVATINRPGACYIRWQRDGDLSVNERVFVAKTGRHLYITLKCIFLRISQTYKYPLAETAGTTVDILIRTVYSLEQRLHDIESGERNQGIEQLL